MRARAAARRRSSAGGRPCTNSAPPSTGSGQPPGRCVSMRPPTRARASTTMHRQPRAPQPPRGLQAGDPRSDDDHIGVTHALRNSIHCSSFCAHVPTFPAAANVPGSRRRVAMPTLCFRLSCASRPAPKIFPHVDVATPLEDRVRRHHRLRRTRREHIDIEAVNALIELALASAGEPQLPRCPPQTRPATASRKRMLVGHGRLPRRRIRIYRSGIGWRRLAPASDSRV